MSFSRIKRASGTPGIRLAKCTDACEIALLSRSEIEYGLPWAWTPEAVARSINNASTNVAIATVPRTTPATGITPTEADALQDLCGFALVYFGRTHAHINLLAVTNAWRRRGVGRRLLEWQVLSARTAGIRYLTLEVRRTNLAAQDFYRDSGFEIRDTVSRYYNNKEDALRMVRKLEVQHES